MSRSVLLKSTWRKKGCMYTRKRTVQMSCKLFKVFAGTTSLSLSLSLSLLPPHQPSKQIHPSSQTQALCTWPDSRLTCTLHTPSCHTSSQHTHVHTRSMPPSKSTHKHTRLAPNKRQAPNLPDKNKPEEGLLKTIIALAKIKKSEEMLRWNRLGHCC